VRRSLAFSLLEQGKVDGAREAFAAVTGIAPRTPTAAAWIATCFLQLRKPAEALREMEAALGEWPEVSRLLSIAGEAQLKADRPMEAVRCYRRILEIEPQSAEGAGGLAKALERAGDLEGAERTLRASAAGAGGVRMQCDLGRFFLRAGKEDAACEVFREALARDPASADARNGLAWSLLVGPGVDAVRIDEAVKLAEALLEEAPRNADMLNTCGLAFLRARRYGEAARALERAERLYNWRAPESAERGGNLLLLAATYAGLLERTKALEAFEKGATLSPGNNFEGEARAAVGRGK
jgi:tetratricopeptide (TPR) repeat protein